MSNDDISPTPVIEIDFNNDDDDDDAPPAGGAVQVSQEPEPFHKRAEKPEMALV